MTPFDTGARVRSTLHRDLAGTVAECTGTGDNAAVTVRLDDGTTITRSAWTWTTERKAKPKPQTEAESLF